MPTLFYPPHAYIPSASGSPQAGALAYFYITATSTPKNTYSDYGLTTPNANPVVADANGVWGPIYLTSDVNYRVTIKTSAGATIYTQDDVSGPLSQADVASIYPPGNVLRYGADASGATDSTAAIQAACNTGYTVYFPKGTFNVSSMITLTTPYQRLYGDGLQSKIFATSNFNVSQQGVFNFTAGGQDDGPWFDKLWFSCDQSVVASSGVRANLIQYPACLFLRGAPRWHVTNCRIDQFLIGIDCQGLSAGGVVIDLDIGCYFLSLAINGSGDTTRLIGFHCIPFNSWTTNQKAIYGDGGNTGIACGRCDGLNLTDSIFYSAGIGGSTGIKAINSFLGTGVNIAGTYSGSGFLSGFTTGLIENTGFDTSATLVQNAVGSWLTVTGCYWSTLTGINAKAIDITAGSVAISNCYFNIGVNPSYPFINISNASGQYIWVEITGSRFNGQSPSGSPYKMIYATGSDPTELSLTGNHFITPNSSFSLSPLIQIEGSGTYLSMTGNRVSITTLGNTQIALSIDTDNKHIISSNAFNGWSIAVPPATPIASTSQTVANPGVFTTAAQTWIAGQAVYITGTAPGGFTIGTTYYVIAGGLTATTAELSATVGGAGIQCTASAACSLVPLSSSTWTNAIVANNSNRGTINFNSANVRALNGQNGAAVVPINSTVYLGPSGYQAGAANVNAFQIPKAGNIIGFRVKANSGPVGVQTYTYTVYKNGAATVMTGSITGAVTNTSVDTNFFAVAANDNVELQLVTSATAVATDHKFSILYEPA